MDLVLFLFIFSLFFYFIFKKIQFTKKLDSEAIKNEVEKDFETDFDHDSSGNLTKQGMLELVEWFEDDLIDRRVNESKEIEGFEELK